MDPNEDLSARVLLRNVLTVEPPRTPLIRSHSKSQSSSLHTLRNSDRLRRKDAAAARTPQDILRRSLKQKLRESTSRARSILAAARKSNPPATASLMYDDDITPRHLLRNILQTEHEASIVVREKASSQEPPLPSPDSSLNSNRLSTGLSDLDLPDLAIGTTVKRLARKRPRRSLNVTVFEKRLKHGDDFEKQGEESADDLSSLSSNLSSSDTLSLKTPFVDALTEKKALRRNRPNRQKISVEEFEARLHRQMAADSNFEKQGEESADDLSSLSSNLSSSDTLSLKTPFVGALTEKKALRRNRPNRQKISVEEFEARLHRQMAADSMSVGVVEQALADTAHYEGFNLGLSGLTEPDITADIIDRNTALYAQPDAVESNSSVAATQDKPSVTGSLLQREMGNNEAEEEVEQRQVVAGSSSVGHATKFQSDEPVAESQSDEEAAVAETQAEEEEPVVESQTDEEDVVGETQSEEEEPVVESQTDEEDAVAGTQPEEEEPVDETDEEDAVAETQSEEEEPVVESQTDEEDAASESGEWRDAPEFQLSITSADTLAKEKDDRMQRDEDVADGEQRDEDDDDGEQRDEDVDGGASNQPQHDVEHISRRTHRSEGGLRSVVQDVSRRTHRSEGGHMSVVQDVSRRTHRSEGGHMSVVEDISRRTHRSEGGPMPVVQDVSQRTHRSEGGPVSVVEDVSRRTHRSEGGPVSVVEDISQRTHRSKGSPVSVVEDVSRRTHRSEGGPVSVVEHISRRTHRSEGGLMSVVEDVSRRTHRSEGGLRSVVDDDGTGPVPGDMEDGWSDDNSNAHSAGDWHSGQDTGSTSGQQVTAQPPAESDLEDQGSAESDQEDQGPVESDQEDQGPVESDQEDQGPAESDQEDQGPAESDLEDQGPAESDLEDQGPAESYQEDQGSAESDQEDQGSAESVLEDQALAESNQEDQGPAESDQEDQGPAESDQEDQGPAESDQEDQGPAESVLEDQALAESDQEDQGPAESDQEDQGPAESDQEDQGSAESDQEDQGPAESDQEDQGPAESDQEDQDPAESDQEDQGPADQEEEWEDEEEDGGPSEDLSMKTPAFVRQKIRFFPPDTPAGLKDIQASHASSVAVAKPDKPKKARAKRTGPAKTEPGLPKTYLMSVFKHFAETKVSPDVYPVLKDTMDKFFDRLADDLVAYALHAKRKTIEVEDVELLLRRQGHVTDKVPVEVLIEKYLPMEYRKILIPIATSGNVVIPKPRR